MATKMKRFFARLMVLCMLINMLPVQTLAEEAQPFEVKDVEGTITYDAETSTVVVEFAPAAEPASEPAAEPVVEEPIVEEPVVEEPVVEEPVVEEPVVEEPVVEEPVVEEPATEEPVSEPAPASEEPADEPAPAAVEPAADNVIVIEQPTGEVDYTSNLTFGDNIDVDVKDITVTEETTEEGATVTTESVTLETTGKTDDGAEIQGEETYTEITTETDTTIQVESTLEGQETTKTESEITPEDKAIPEVEVPVLPGDLMEGVKEGTTVDEETGDVTTKTTEEIVDENGNKVTVENMTKTEEDKVTTAEKEVVVESEKESTYVEDYSKYKVYESHTEATTTTTEKVTVTEQEKVEEENKTVETSTTTTIDKTTVENFEENALELRDGDKVLQRQDVNQETDTVVDVTTEVIVTEITKEVIGDLMEGEDDTEYDFTNIETTIIRDVTADITLEVKDESTFDMDQVVAPENYEGKGYNTTDLPELQDYNHREFDGLQTNSNPNGKNPGPKPEDESYNGYDYVLSGEGDSTWAAAPVFMNIVYKKNADGTPQTDKDGNYIIDEDASQLVYAGDKAGYSGMNGTPGQIVVKNENGEFFYTYCIDKDTPTTSNSWYKITNLEDSDYYPDDESAAKLRAIVTNGYWGTDAYVYETNEDGTVKTDENGNKVIKKDEKGNNMVDETVTGSLAKMKALLLSTYGSDYKLIVKDEEGKDAEYTLGEIVDGLKEHEAVAATQAAIWSYSNGSLATLNGQDGVVCVGVQSAHKYYNAKKIDGVTVYGASALNQYGPAYNTESDARLKALYECLMGLKPMESDPEETSTVINETNFVEEVTLTVGDKVENNEANYDDNDKNDVYETELNFTLAFTPDPNSDDLLVHLLDAKGNKIIGADGKPIVKRLAGQNSEGEDHETIQADENGVYTLSGLQLSENQKFEFDLKLTGTHLLKEGVYVFTSHGGTGHSQTLVGLAEGTQNVNVSASMTISFNVDESKNVVATRVWREEVDPVTEELPPPPTPEGEEEEPQPRAVYRMRRGVGQLEIIEEEVPLAAVPQTGDMSILWFAMILMSGCGLFVMNLQDKRKCKE